MTSRFVLGCALLLPLVLGCSSSTTTAVSKGEGPGVTPSHRPSERVPAHSETPQPVTEKPKPTPAVAPMNPAITRTKDAGILRGRVLAKGGKGVADVAVWVSAPELKSPEPTEPIALVQAQGRYTPRVLFARVGQQLEVRTSDARADFNASGVATFSDSLRKGQVRAHRLTTPGIVEVRSQLHPDMPSAWVHVVAHDWHAISEADGTFRLPALSPGEYTVILVHNGAEPERSQPVGQRVSVKVEKGEGASIEWTLPGKGDGRDSAAGK